MRPGQFSGTFAAFVLTFLLSLPASAEGLRTAKIFSSHMVLQSDLRVPIWGRSEAGAVVVVEFSGRQARTKADGKGRWKLALEPLKASSTGRELVIRSGDDRVVIEDVLVGEVWFAGGQSNMDYRVGGMARRLAEGRALVKAAELPAIRFRKINESNSPSPQEDLKRGGGWVVCSPGTVSGFSAVAYVFAQRLHRELGVPVGVMDCSWGGTPIEPYIPIEAFKGHPTLERLGELGKAGDIAGVRALTGGTYARSAAWLAGAIYNGRIAPVAPYAIRGAIWYQAESNCGRGEDPRDYAHKMRALIRGWRGVWGRKNLPVYFVQLPQWPSYAWTWMREEQRRALDEPGTGMAVTIDLDYANDIHPPNKIDVGERLARWPLAKVYSRKVPVSGPLFRGVELRAGTAVVSFLHADGGLMAGKLAGVMKLAKADDGVLHAFELVGKDGAWHAAEAKIDGETVVVTSKQVPSPVAVRYACYAAAPAGRAGNLYNTEGLPASPFCSDWTRMPYDPARNPMGK